MARVSSLPRVVRVAEDSPASRAGLLVGDEIVAVDGLAPRDLIEWRFATDAADPSITFMRGGLEQEADVLKADGAPLGIEVDSAVFDRVRTCDNHCEFCFIHQLPKGLRRSLYLKDDDYRLSFLYGNFTTLTRFTEADLERVVTERLSPLHVSIHATEGGLRSRMLKNRRGAMSLRWLRALLDHGIEVRAQVVVCPGVNDGDHLDDTLAGLLDRYPEISTIAVVPLGVSRFNPEQSMREHTVAEAREVIDVVDRWRSAYRTVVGRSVVHLADEYYLRAGREFPGIDAYEGCEMHEDGVGMARTFEAEFHGQVGSSTGPKRGFFVSVDGGGEMPPNPAAYTGLRAESRVELRSATPRSGAIGILTGELGAAVLEPLIASLDRRDVRLLPVRNEFFGGNTVVTGLMTFEDVSRVLATEPEGDRYLLPDVCLSDDGRFLDGGRSVDLPRRVEIVPTDGSSLRRALRGTV